MGGEFPALTQTGPGTNPAPVQCIQSLFPHSHRPVLGPTQPLYNAYKASFRTHTDRSWDQPSLLYNAYKASFRTHTDRSWDQPSPYTMHTKPLSALTQTGPGTNPASIQCIQSLFPHSHRPVLGPTQPPIQCIQSLFPESKVAGAWR